jgi:hypothetical protein
MGHDGPVRHTILALGVAGLLVVGGPASADSLGQTGTPLVVCATGGAGAAVLGAQAAGQATYVAASAGVLTSFTHVANPTPGQVRVIVFGPVGAGNHLPVVAKSPKQTVVPGASNTFPVRLPVRAGDRIGIGVSTTNMACLTKGVAGDVAWLAPFDPDASSDFGSTTTSAGNRPNISAVLEPDADGDGYGDTTQDACPQSALSQVACPVPDTTVTKKPKRTRANAKVKVKFTATVAGSTFQCSLDGRKFRPCTSPYKKKLGVGSHSLRIRAVSPAGLVDPKPAKVKVRITGY